jgi:putative phage-type endonuclease
MKIHNLEQYSPEWWTIRQKRMTASKASCIQANGKGLVTYINEIMAEYYSNAEPVRYTNEAMEQGTIREEEARALYCLENNIDIKEIGFITDGSFIGASPDGVIGEDGLIEIKSPTDRVFFEFMLNRKIKPEYYAQMQMQLLVTGRKYCIYCVYNPNYDPCILTENVLPDEKMFEKLRVGFETGTAMIKEIEEKMSCL